MLSNRYSEWETSNRWYIGYQDWPRLISTSQSVGTHYQKTRWAYLYTGHSLIVEASIYRDDGHIKAQSIRAKLRIESLRILDRQKHININNPQTFS